MTTADMLYQGWDMEGRKDAGDVADHAHTPLPGFTAINQCSHKPSSPPQDFAVSHTQRKLARTASTSKRGQRRNPTVASYLGLGTSEEPLHLVRYAPTPYDQPPPQRSRRPRVTRTGETAPSRPKTKTSKHATSQRRVSESSRVTKSSVRSASHILDGSTDEHLPSPAATAIIAQRQQADHKHSSQGVVTERTTNLQNETTNTHALVPYVDDEADFNQLCFDFDINTNDVTNTISTHTSDQIEPSQVQFDDDDFDDDLMDDDLLDLTIDNDARDGCSSPQFDASSTKTGVQDSFQRIQTPPMFADTSLVLDEESRYANLPSRKFVSPVTLTTRLVAATGDDLRKPIVRPPFPAAVSDQSPIVGLSSNTVLRSCFRIGEAISQSCHAANAGNRILIELYARVLSSERDDLQQRFTFCDLFHTKPPYIQASYAAAIWKTVQLFEYDSTRLLQPGRICRCIGTIKRNGKDWSMTVLNIWEATWDDVQWVQGIVNS